MSYHDKYGNFFDEYGKNNDSGIRSNDSRIKEIEEKRRQKRKKTINTIIRLLTIVVPLLLIIALLAGILTECSKGTQLQNNGSYTQLDTNSNVNSANQPVNTEYKKATVTENTVTLGSEIESNYAILIDTSNNTVLAQKSSEHKISPASMTKVMTLLVAAENIDSIDSTFKMTSDIIDPLYRENLTLAGFAPGEDVLIKDMFYAMVLKSAAEAASGLAVHIAGSEKAFVEMMNDKAKELGLTSTHFTNTSGLHEDGHYTTAHEMAIIMQAAIQNDFCRTLLTTKQYTVAANEHHDKIEFYNGMFTRLNGNEPKVATILGGKTGYTIASRNCLVSFARTDDNRIVICVTADAGGKEKPVDDCIKMYKKYTHPKSKVTEND